MTPQIEHLPIAGLIPYARNSRTHSEEQIAAVAASIREYGFTNPVLIREDGGIIAGHGRVLAALSMGLDAIPCIRLSHLTEAQARAYVIADNKLAELAGWDEEILALELKELGEMDFDLSLTGFGEDEISELLAEMDATPEGATDADSLPAAPVIPVSRAGDVWLLGRHRLVCGSSTDAATVAKALSGSTPHLMVTDPPYGIEYDANWRNEAMSADGSPVGGGAIGAVLNDDIACWREAWALFPGEVAYVWHASSKTHIVADSLVACDFELRALLIWNKNHFAISRCHYHPKHEPCWYVVKKGGTGHWQGDRTQSTVWEIPKNLKSETGHSTQKPVECMRRPIENNSRAGDGVYEPFSGSGTTIIAAEQTGRTCYAIELSPIYVDMAVLRWQEYTGGGATLEGDGRKYNQIAASGRA